jgi:hypothetical protein
MALMRVTGNVVILTKFSEKYSVLVGEGGIVTWENIYVCTSFLQGIHGSADGRNAMLQAAKSWVRVPVRPLKFFFFNLPNSISCTIASDSASTETEYQKQKNNVSGEYRGEEIQVFFRSVRRLLVTATFLVHRFLLP